MWIWEKYHNYSPTSQGENLLLGMVLPRAMLQIWCAQKEFKQRLIHALATLCRLGHGVVLVSASISSLTKKIPSLKLYKQILMVRASCKTLYMLSHTQPCHNLGTETIFVYWEEGWWVFDIGGSGGYCKGGSLQILDLQ